MKAAIGARRGLVVGWVAAALALGCGQVSEPQGSLMLAISTDMYIDKDLSRVDIIVQPESGPTQSTQVNLFPELEGKFLPGTFSIVEGSTPGELVRIRIIARQGSQVRVVREASLKVPRERTALLSMPIQWLCDGQVRPDGQLFRSDCDNGYTCVSGTCQVDAIDETTLPDYAIEEVFGGGDATGNGECFDTLGCLAGGFEPSLDLETCQLDVEPEANLNVAVALPPGGDGHCDAVECLIPLDKSQLTGWWATAGGGPTRVQLPPAVCERARTGGAKIRASHNCAAKYPGTPTCGPWSVVGTEPGGSPGIPPLVTTSVGNSAALAAELTAVTQRITDDTAAACARLAGSSPPANATAADVSALCAQAAALVEPLTPLSWHHVPARCWPDHERQLSCERDCSPACDPGSIEERCEQGSLTGVCDGDCESRRCMGSAALPVTCPGACAGVCDGRCDGNCMGICEGACSYPSPDGYCDGQCDGVCRGLCEGRCEGTCAGHCDGDPTLNPGTCDNGGLCRGQCSTGSRDAICEGPLGHSVCPDIDPSCVDDCRALAHFKLTCDSPTAWVMPKPGLMDDMLSALATAVPELVSVRDLESFVVMQEGTIVSTRMTGDPTVLPAEMQAVEEALAQLAAAVSSATNLLTSLGNERGFSGAPGSVGPGDPVGPGPGAISCTLISAGGSRPVVDDFEDGDARSLVEDGRDGEWYLVHDGTGAIGPAEPLAPENGGPGASVLAMHVWGSGFTEWGAALGLNLRAGGAPYDAAVHQGIRFWARGNTRLKLSFMQQNLDPGHPCSTCDFQSQVCGSFYGTDVSLTEDWTQYLVPWALLTRNPGDGTEPFGPEQLLSLQFEAPAPAAFDFWIDNVEFY